MERKYYLRGLGLGIAVTAIIMGILTSHDKAMTDHEIIVRAKELGMVENTVLSDLDNEEPAKPESSEDEDGGPENGSQGKAGDQPAASGEAVDAGQASGQDEDETEQPDSDKPGSIVSDEGSNEDIGTNGSAAEADEEEDGEAGSGISTPDDTENESAENEPVESEGDSNEENNRDIITAAAVKTITVNSGDGSHTVAKKLADAGVVSSADTFDDFLCRYGYDKKLRTGTFSIPADASDEQIARIVTGAE